MGYVVANVRCRHVEGAVHLFHRDFLLLKECYHG